MGKGKGKGGCGVMSLAELPPGVEAPEQTVAGMQAAAREFAQAISAGEQVAVFCDYDPDGTSGAAALRLALDDHPALWGFASASDGTGLTEDFVRQAHAAGAKLLVSVDLGSSQPAALDLARELGLRTIVVDHHAAHQDADPDHHLNPTLAGSSQASGAVLAYKLALALETELYGAPRPTTAWQGAWLAGFGARADMMDMTTPENAALAALDAEHAPPGMRAAMAKLGLRSLSKTNLTKIAALLNLCKRTRLADAQDAAAILSASSEAEAEAPLERLLAVRERCNQASRDLGSEAARHMIRQPPARVAAAVLRQPEAYLYSGYAGIVAMRMSGAARRPAVIFIPLDDEASAYKYSVRWTRAPKDLGRGVLDAVDDLGRINADFGPPGGHPQAMGGTCLAADLPRVQQVLEDWAARRDLPLGQLD